MSIRFFSIRAFVPAACLLTAMAVTVAPSFSQEQPAPAAQTPAPDAQTRPAPPSASKEPDYPDRRSFFIGLTGLSPLQNDSPDIRGGKTASSSGLFESLPDIGKPYRFVLQGEAGIPVSRTGMLYADFERYHGDGTQILAKDALINNINFTKGDVMTSRYSFLTGRIYLDDLLYPHKFPVSKFRLKSIWGLRFASIRYETQSSTEDDTLGTPGASYGVGTPYIFYPEFGLAMEYAVSKHALFRVDGEGFAFPHRSVLTEGGASLSFRRENLEILMGVKALHFKTSPQKEEYMIGTFITPFVGFRWYF